MKILFLTNNDNSINLFNWLKYDKNEDVHLFDKKLTLEFLEDFNPNFIISYNYKYIIKPEVINIYKNKIINLHISLLPWNRGSNPNIWSFIENTPKGVSIFYIDEGIDTGDILLSKEVFFDEESTTLNSSYLKLHEEMQNLFKSNWNDLRSNRILPKRQIGTGSYHNMKDFELLKERIQLDDFNISIQELKRRCKN